MPRRAIRIVSTLLLVVATLALAGCVHRATRKLVTPGEAATLDRRSPYLKVHARDGNAYVLTKWSVDSQSRTVVGHGELLGTDRQLVRSGPFTVPLDSVALFETNVLSRHGSVLALSIITGVSAVITLACITNPKACFGSCPTFYATDGDREVLQAEGFSASVAPALEARDIDALYRLRPRSRQLEVRMKNEALETHVIRSVHVLAADRGTGDRVFVTSGGEFWRAREALAPITAVAAEGDCGAALRACDGIERFSVADSADLAARESVDLVFAAAPGGRLGLALGMRQTLLSTFLFYQSLAWMGRSTGTMLAALERGAPDVRHRAGGLWRTLGGIEVLVQDSQGAWIRAGELFETGPLATDVKLVTLPELPPGPVRIRLSMTRGLWRLDWVALAVLDERVTPLRLAPTRVLRGGNPDEAARALLESAGDPLVTTRGDEYTLVFELPERFDRYEMFLESQGYYLEWMRDEWVAEEDAGKALQMFLDPARTLRDLAPAFKRIEPEMEGLFWGSRHGHP